ncbi:type II toxin-antitoxin system Phd/YefM family antitoxin [Subtercola boreus]|uniref:type II toxin-antitoxin system Phd/YefM family antitoxin n=1 Tax=Subtercola boreus TaxID=120213 RepID=UPI0011C03676|nr:type II toxin-antitoxin system Phd/YefM family antitoxin [Subtercola boreus]
MSLAASSPILPSREARTELPKALKRFRAEGSASEPLIFGSHRKAEAVVIPFELYTALLPAIEELEIADLVRERSSAGSSVPLSDLADQLGLDAADYR